jgi:leader peptidase (prepilin peptidase)/N-methyltransferase
MMGDLLPPEFLHALTGPAWVPLAALLGLLVGSFLNVVIGRLPAEFDRDYGDGCRAFLAGTEPPPGSRWGWIATLFTPGSHCPKCRAPVRAADNIPVASWLLLGRRCRACAAPISWRYPAIEILTAALSAWTAAALGAGPQGLAALGFVWWLIALAAIDAETTLLPNQLTHPLLWLGLLLNLRATFVPLDEAVVGAIAGYLSLWIVYRAFKVLTGREGMGYGDFNLLAAMGAWLGWKMLLPIVLLASLVGAVVGILQILLGQRRLDMPAAFGPYLAAAGLLAILHGRELTRLLEAVVGALLGLFGISPVGA